MDTTPNPKHKKSLWHIVRVFFYTFRKGITKRKLMLDVHFLLKRRKLTGKAFKNLMSLHHHHKCEAPLDAECNHHKYEAEFAKVFEVFDSKFDVGSPYWGEQMSPMPIRQLRVTDSPFPMAGEDDGCGEVDKEAEVFIRRFYEQLRGQQRLVELEGW